MEEKLLSVARSFIASNLDINYTATEEKVVQRFFTNSNKRIFFIHTLPANMIAVLMAMYSRLKNRRGIRGTFVDTFLPQALASFVPECDHQHQGDVMAFLKHAQISSLDSFINYSDDTRKSFQDFLDNIKINPEYLQQLSQGEKMRKFLFMWLDKYGHNSIARPAMLYICFEQISILAAKSIEWCRPGAGYIELSTRYVDMAGKDVYPIAQELALYKVGYQRIEKIIKESFSSYIRLEGENNNGPFPQFLINHYRGQVPEEKLVDGAFGESCDVLGNLLPASTLTSLGIGISGESLPVLIQHLRLDATAENEAIAEAIIEEADKIGATQFLRHLEISQWTKDNWTYLSEQSLLEQYLIDPVTAEKILLAHFKRNANFIDCQNWSEVINKLAKMERSAYDKLPREFEHINGSFSATMTFRGWRDLHRMGYCTHRRGYLTPNLGFYQYDKPAPKELTETFTMIHRLNQDIYQELTKANVPAPLKQYPLALGNIIPFTVGANLRQWEFANWQRTKPSVNHEVRQIFLWIENSLRQYYPWWSKISRADVTPTYIFARGNSNIPLK